MVNSGDQPHPNAVEVHSGNGNDSLHPTPNTSYMGLMTALSPATLEPLPSIRREPSLGLDCASQSASGPPGDVDGSPSNGQRVQFEHQVHHNTDTDTKRSSPMDQISTPIDTPLGAAVSPDGNANPSELCFGSHLRRGVQRQEEQGAFSVGTLLPLPRTKLPTTRKISFEKEMRVALERIPGDKITLQDRKNLMTMLGSYSAPVSVQVSPALTPRTSLEGETRNVPALGCKESLRILPEDLEMGGRAEPVGQDGPREDKAHETVTTEAHKLVRAHTQKGSQSLRLGRKEPSRGLESGASTPVEQMGVEQIRSGVLTTLLKLYNAQNSTPHNQQSSVPTSPTVSGRTTPKWYNKNASSLPPLLGFGLTGSSQTLTSTGTHDGSSGGTPTDFRIPKSKRRPSGAISGMLNKLNKQSVAEEIKITIHIAKLLSRQRYVLKLCKALMLYGVSKDIQICMKVGT